MPRFPLPGRRRRQRGQKEASDAAPQRPIRRASSPGALRRERKAILKAREELLRDLGGLAMEMYANANHQHVPLGATGTALQENYGVWLGRNDYGQQADQWQPFGVLFYIKLIQTPQVLYCPSEKLGYFEYDSTLNPWRPGQPDGPFVRSAYGMRSLLARRRRRNHLLSHGGCSGSSRHAGIIPRRGYQSGGGP